MIPSVVAFEARLRLRGLIILSMAIAVLVVLTVWSWKPIGEDIETLQELLAQFPEEFIKFFAKGGVYTLNFDTYYIMNFHGFFYTCTRRLHSLLLG